MKLSDLHPDDVTLVSAAPDDDTGPLKISALHPDDVQLVQGAPTAAQSAFRDTTKSLVDSLPMLGGVAGGILGTPADALTGPLGNIGGAAIGGYLGTATKNLINRYYDPASAPQNMTQTLTQPVVGGVEQGLMQGTGEAVAPYVAKGIQAAADAGKGAAKWTGTKLLSSLGGVKPATIQEYAQFPDRINSAPSVDKLKDISDDFVGKLASDIEAKKITLDQANEAFKGFQSDLSGAYNTAGHDAKDAVTSAQQSLKDAHNTRLQQMSGDIYDTVNKLKGDVQAGSTEAMKTLDKSNAMIDLAPTYAQIDSTIAGLQKKGTDESLAVADKLQAYKDRQMAKYGTNVPGPDAKALIQGLDQITEYSPMAGSFDKAKNAAFKGIRGTLDQSVKSTVPEYAQAMEPVAANSKLLDRVSNFGDKQSAVGLLQRINAPNQLENRAALQELGQKYGADFVAGAQPENLPEQQLLNRAQGAKDALRSDRVAQKIDQTVGASRQKAALDQAQAGYQTAQDNLAPFKSLAPNGAGQTQAQAKLTALGKGGNIELTEMFQKLGKLTNTDFVQAMKDQHTLAAFQKGATNGSRNTLMGAIVGWAFGGTTGGAIGAGAGRAVDQWGPAATKKILDGVIQVSKSPTVETISRLNLPDPIKRNMIVGLENYLSNAGKSAAQAAGEGAAQVAGSGQQKTDRAPSGQAAWTQAGLSRLGLDQNTAQRAMQDPKGMDLIHQASNYAPGSKALKQILNQIQSKWGSK